MWRVVDCRADSEAVVVGRAREASIEDGEAMSSIEEGLLRLAGEDRALSPDVLFLVTLFAAFKICFESLSSLKISWITVMLILAMESGLELLQHQQLDW